ncbi:hypothetical protein Salmuc_02091 [Salipiger mucosus DSM 16094]|uniref:Uncharacterized protein n=1 Tax=Salipiger mucosus DSM 16094 TaxID=1123237 RepID=S9QV46_9RHOB|nr:hypothetical protein Salmuc_02091 [Salipiger mucosus DSM 16094]
MLAWAIIAVKAWTDSDPRRVLVRMVGEGRVQEAETYAEGIEVDLARALARVSAMDADATCRELAARQVKAVSVQTAGMMDLILKSEEWTSMTEVIEDASRAYFDEGCPTGPGMWLLARKHRNSQKTQAIIRGMLSVTREN